MPIVTVSQLIKVVTRDEALATLIEVMQGLGFETTSWQSGSIQRSVLEMAATVWSETSGVISVIANGGFNQLASGEMLTQFSDSHYDNQRHEATETEGDMVLEETDGGGPFFFAAGDVVAVDSLTGETFRNTAAGNLNPSSELTLAFAAETAGTDGNIVDGSTLDLQTSIAGVEISNPAIGTTGTWITKYGTDEELDRTLKARNRSKWAQRSQARPEDALVFIALDAVDPNGVPVGITKVAVNSSNPGGVAGAVDVYIANDATTASALQVTNVDLVMQRRRSTSSVLQTLPANIYDQKFYGDVSFNAGADPTQVGADVQSAVAAMFAVMPINGALIGPFLTGIALSEVIGAITNVDNVINVTLFTDAGKTIPFADVSLGGTFALPLLGAEVWNATATGTLDFVAI